MLVQYFSHYTKSYGLGWYCIFQNTAHAGWHGDAEDVMEFLCYLHVCLGLLWVLKLKNQARVTMDSATSSSVSQYNLPHERVVDV